MEQVLRGIGVTAVETVDPLDLNKAIGTVRAMADREGVKAIIFQSPCIAVTRPSNALRVDAEKCVKCKKCITSLGCPAISLRDEKAYIDGGTCTGCGLCAQVCPVNAIGGGERHA